MPYVEYSWPSRCRSQVLADDEGMAGRDSEQRDRGTVGLSAVRLPVAKRMDTDAHRLGELLLCEAHEASQCKNVQLARRSSRRRPKPPAAVYTVRRGRKRR